MSPLPVNDLAGKRGRLPATGYTRLAAAGLYRCSHALVFVGNLETEQPWYRSRCGPRGESSRAFAHKSSPAAVSGEGGMNRGWQATFPALAGKIEHRLPDGLFHSYDTFGTQPPNLSTIYFRPAFPTAFRHHSLCCPRQWPAADSTASTHHWRRLLVIHTREAARWRTDRSSSSNILGRWAGRFVIPRV